MADRGKPRIFLCHAKEDKPRVRDLYHQLKAAGYQPWLDEEDILPGQDWEREIRRAIRSSEIFLACLSEKSLTRKGYIHKEIGIALDELEKMPEDKIYLIPVRLEACTVPDRLGSRQWLDLFAPGGFEKLRQALDTELGRSRQPFEPELILIPAGEFLMGSDPKKDKDAAENEQPQYKLYLPDYHIVRTPVTNAQYAAFVEAEGHAPPRYWESGKPPAGKEQHPVVGVTWHCAMAYCKWLSERTGKAYRLPSEAEWEKAARGTDGQLYPWGDEPPDESLCNFHGNVEGTTPAGQYSPGGNSPYGVADMAGNVWEWTQSLWGKEWVSPDFRYPDKADDGRENLEAGDDIYRVLRGGAFDLNERGVRCACRYRGYPDIYGRGVGFRVVAPL